MQTELEERVSKLAVDYAHSVGLHIVEQPSIELEYAGFWVFRRARTANVTLQTDEGVVAASIWPDLSTLHSFILTPEGEDGVLLPLWIAFPRFDSVTLGWRQGTGEPYKYKWHEWWNSLSDARKRQYRLRFPEPTDAERGEWTGGWEGFYDEIAEVPADPESIPDFIFGRVPRSG